MTTSTVTPGQPGSEVPPPDPLRWAGWLATWIATVGIGAIFGIALMAEGDPAGGVNGRLAYIALGGIEGVAIGALYVIAAVVLTHHPRQAVGRRSRW